MTCDRFDVVVVPFPFTDRPDEKRRPALVLSDERLFNKEAGHCVMAMITSARHSRWPLDVEITDLAHAGLPSPCVVRMKLFTLPVELVQRKSGSLSPLDAQAVQSALNRLWGARYPCPGVVSDAKTDKPARSARRTNPHKRSASQ